MPAAITAGTLGGLVAGAVIFWMASWWERRRLARAQARADARRPGPVMLCLTVDGYPVIELDSDALYHVAKFGMAGDDLLNPVWSLGGGLALGEPLRVSFYAWPKGWLRPPALRADVEDLAADVDQDQAADVDQAGG